MYSLSFGELFAMARKISWFERAEKVVSRVNTVFLVPNLKIRACVNNYYRCYRKNYLF